MQVFEGMDHPTQSRSSEGWPGGHPAQGRGSGGQPVKCFKPKGVAQVDGDPREEVGVDEPEEDNGAGETTEVNPGNKGNAEVTAADPRNSGTMKSVAGNSGDPGTTNSGAAGNSVDSVDSADSVAGWRWTTRSSVNHQSGDVLLLFSPTVAEMGLASQRQEESNQLLGDPEDASDLSGEWREDGPLRSGETQQKPPLPKSTLEKICL